MKTNYTELYKQALPYMEANTSSLNGIAIAVFIGFLGFGLWAYFTSEKKSFIPLIILVIIGAGVAGFLFNLSKKRSEMLPYLVTGEVGEKGYDPAYEKWYFTIKGNEYLEISKGGSFEMIKKEENEFYFWNARKKGQEGDVETMVPYFYSIHDNIEVGETITLLIVPKEAPLGFVINGKLQIME